MTGQAREEEASQLNRSRDSVRVERRSDLNESDLGEVYCMCSNGAHLVLEYNMNPAWALSRPAIKIMPQYMPKLRLQCCVIHFKLVD